MIGLLNYTSADGFKLFGKSLNKDNIPYIKEKLSPSNLIGKLGTWWNGDSSQWKKLNPIPDQALAQSTLDKYKKGYEEHKEIEKLIQSYDNLNEVEQKYLRTRNLENETADTYIDFLKEENRQIEENNKKYQGFKGTLKDVGKSMLAMGGNILTDLAISWVVGKIIEGFQKLANAQEDAIKKATELREEYDAQSKSIEEGRKTIAEIGKEYINLNKYYDSTGKNIRLTDEELARHQELTSQIASILPEMVIGYDALGNPILKAVDSVQQLNNALDEQEKKLNRDIVSDGEAIFDGFNATVTKQKKWPWEEAGIQEKIAAAQSLFNPTAMGWTADGTMSDALNTVLDEMDVEKEYKLHPEKIAKDEEMRKQVQNYISSLMAELDVQNENVAQYANAFLELQDGYAGLNDTTKTILSNAIANYNYADNGKHTQKDVNAMIYEIMSRVPLNEESILEAFEELNNTKGDKDITALEWNDIVSKIFSDLTRLTGLDSESLAIALDIEINEAGEVLNDGRNVTTMIDELNKKFGETNGQFEKMSFADLSKAYDIALSKTDTFTGSLDQLKKRLELVEDAADSLTFTDYENAVSLANPGDTYVAMDEALTTTKESWDKGLVGTDEFKTFAELISPEKFKDPNKYVDNFLKNYKTMQKYFTEDHTGPQKMLDALVELGDIDKKSDGSYVGMIENTAEAAEKLGLSTYSFEQILNRLKDYGFEIDFNSVTESVQEANSAVAELQTIWENLGEGDAKTKLGEEIEEYKQKIIEFNNEGELVPDHLIKEIEFKVTYTKTGEELANESNVISGMRNTESKSERLAEYNADASSFISDLTGQLNISDKSDLTGKWAEQYADSVKTITDANEKLQKDLANGESLYTIIQDQEAVKTAQDTHIEFLNLLNQNREAAGLVDPTEGYTTILNNLEKPTDNVEELLNKLQQMNISVKELNSIDFNDGSLSEGKLGTLESTFDNLLGELNLSKENIEDLKRALQELDILPVEPDIEIAEVDADEVVKNSIEFPATPSISQEDANKFKDEIVDKLQTPEFLVKMDNGQIEPTIELTKELNEEIALTEETETKPVINTEGIEHATTEVKKFNTELDKIQSKTVTISIQQKVKSDTSQGATKYYKGTAHVAGTSPKIKSFSIADGYVGRAFSKGNWGAPKTETALVGELGPEIIVRDGKFFTVGDNGAEFAGIRKGDIIFNHKQTEELLKNGRVTSGGGRAKAAGGNAFLEGTAYKNTALDGKFKGGISDDSSSSKKKDSTTKDNSNKSKEVVENLFDWIERRIKKFQTKFERWLGNAETALTDGFIEKYYNKAAKNEKSLMTTYGKAYKEYLKEANDVGLSAKYKSKVKNGRIDLQNIKDEKLAEKINKYQEYYDKAQDSLDGLSEAAKTFYNIPIEEAARKIEVLSESFDLLDAKLENAIGVDKNGVLNKNKIIDEQSALQTQMLGASKEAVYDATSNRNSAKRILKKSTKNKKVIAAANANQEVDLSLFKEGSKAYKNAVKYNESVKALSQAQSDYNNQLQETIAWEREAAKAKFDNVADEYAKKIQMLDHGNTYLENKIAEVEASGAKVNIGYYKEQIKLNDKKKAQLNSEKTALEAQLKLIPAGTDEWHDAYSQLQDVNSEISSCTQSAYEYNNAINQAHFDLFDNIHNEVDRLMEEQAFLRDMMSHEKMVDTETGQFTDAGLANLASLTSDKYASEVNEANSKAMVERLNKMVESGTLSDGELTFNSFDDLEAAREEYYDKWREDIKTTRQLEEEIYNSMKEQYEGQLEAMKELIDSKKEALRAEQDLYNYQNTIADKTKNISTLQKRIAAYQGDTSEEGMAKLQKLQTELADAEKDLRETEYDRYISDQENLMDTMYSQYEELINNKLDDFQSVVEEGIKKAEENATTANGYLLDLQNSLGYNAESSEGTLIGETGGIKTQIETVISKLTTLETKIGGTNGGTPTDANTDGIVNNPDAVPTTSGTTEESLGKENQDVLLLEKAEAYVEKKVSKAKKKKSEYSDVNKVFYEQYNGKVLSGAELKKLAEKLGVTYNNAKKSGNLYKKLKEIKFPGFSRGGVVSINDLYKQVKANGDDGIISAKNGERILPVQDSKRFELFTKHLSSLNDCFVAMNDLERQVAELQNVSAQVTELSSGGYEFGDAIFNFEVNGVNDVNGFLQAIQTKEVQRAIQSVTIDRINGSSGRLSVRNIK